MQVIKSTNPTTFKVGDIFYECQYGANLEARVTEAPTLKTLEDGRRQWSWTAENTQNGEKIEYLVTEGLEHYGPRIYEEPQYFRFRDEELFYPLVGELALKEQDHG